MVPRFQNHMKIFRDPQYFSSYKPFATPKINDFKVTEVSIKSELATLAQKNSCNNIYLY